MIVVWICCVDVDEFFWWQGLKEKKVVGEKVALKKSTTVISNQPTTKQIQPHVEPVLPVAPVLKESSMAPSIHVEERQEEAVAAGICEMKKLPVLQETVIEVEEVRPQIICIQNIFHFSNYVI